jgi:hypothetical protein
MQATLSIDGATSRRQIDLSAYLDAAGEEAAASAAYEWIKALRHARVDDLPLRRRFTFRDDSLWWFAELYLHKEQVVLNIFRTLLALESLIAREGPRAIGVVEGDTLVRTLAPQVAANAGVSCRDRAPAPWGPTALAEMNARATWLQGSALASRLRRREPAAGNHPPAVLAFVHRAFWRTTGPDGSAEQYIGPVLRALEHRLPDEGIRYVSVGPAANFRARRWWHPVVGHGGEQPTPPVEDFASLRALRPSRHIWRTRHAMLRALWNSADVRAHATIRECDCWGIVRAQLAGIALLQWPWSARAMDEAGAALDAIGPAAALTYAEAGGWGRAIVLECRRRGIPVAGLQHGFIYRHWLNYLHEADEMAPDQESPADIGFPRPSMTLLYDGYAAQHLVGAGRFPPESLRVTGNARLDDLTATARTLTTEDLANARASAGVGPSDALVLITTKWKEAQWVLPALLQALARVEHVHLAIKTHPAETPDDYEPAVRGLEHVRVLPAAAPLAPLLAASRAVVTVNSTVALDAAVLGVPALVVGLPNNLSPFVDARIMVGAGPAEAADALRRILYDEEFRHRLNARRQAYLSRFQIRSDGQAAERTADAVLRLVDGMAPAADR